MNLTEKVLAHIKSNLCTSNNGNCDGEHLKKDGLAGEWFALRRQVAKHTESYPLASSGKTYCQECSEYAKAYHREYPCHFIKEVATDLGISE